MDLYHLAVGLLLFWGASYATTDSALGTSLLPSPSSLPSTQSSMANIFPGRTQHSVSLLDPRSDATSLPSPSLPHHNQNQTQLLVPTQQQIQRSRLPQGRVDAVPVMFPIPDVEDSDGSQEWEAAAGGVAMVLMKPKGQLGVENPHGAASHAMGLFLGGCGLILCLFIGVYCAYRRGSKKEPFSHHRLYQDGFDDPALFLDNPKDYDWFFYETEGYVYPTSSQTQPKLIQTLSVPALKQPSPALETSPTKHGTSEMQDVKQNQANVVKLVCLSPDNLHSGNVIGDI